MRFECVAKNIVKSETELRNDAFEMWYDLTRYGEDFKLTHQLDAVTIFYNRSGKIEAGKDYLEYTFVDVETREVSFLNTTESMDKISIRNDIYPPVIKNAIINFEIKQL